MNPIVSTSLWNKKTASTNKDDTHRTKTLVAAVSTLTFTLHAAYGMQRTIASEASIWNNGRYIAGEAVFGKLSPTRGCL